MPTNDGSLSTKTSESPTSRILSLPHGLLQSLFSSIINFEPWTYASAPESANIISDNDTLSHTCYAKPVNLTSNHRTIIGLSSGNNWLMLILSRHPYHLSRTNKIGISSAITQALRRMNAQLEQSYWARRDIENELNSRMTSTTKGFGSAKSNRTSFGDSATRQTATNLSMKQYHASVETEEEPCSGESVGTQRVCTARSVEETSSTTTALIVYRPVPVLKITSQNLMHFANRPQPTVAIEQVTALLVAVLLTLVQCRMALLENLEKLERDTPILSIEPCESKDDTTPKMSPRHNRMRSMSGSTVVEAVPHKEPLSFSAILTVYALGSGHKEVKWAEKRESDEKDTGTLPQRPRLTDYKQVSSGRVATLMDRFEKFHL